MLLVHALRECSDLYTALCLYIWPINRREAGKVLRNEAEGAICVLELDPPAKTLCWSRFSSAKETPTKYQRKQQKPGLSRNPVATGDDLLHVRAAHYRVIP
jgi:hypothetical protein